MQNKTVGILGAGRIGSAYARMMVEGHKMDLVYYDVYQNKGLEDYVTAYGAFLASRGERAVTVTRAASVEDVLRTADVVSLHTVLDASTTHLLNRARLALMKPDAVLVNAARGPIIDEKALVVRVSRPRQGCFHSSNGGAWGAHEAALGPWETCDLQHHRTGKRRCAPLFAS